MRRYITVLKSLILRDIKSRFLGSSWGYLLSLGWPLSHIGFLLILHGAFGRIQPYGESAAVWYSTGIVPFMAFSYTMRFIILGLIQNYPLLSFPVVKIMDIIIARTIIEIISVFMVFCIISVVLNFVGVSFIPTKPLLAFYAVIMSLSLGISFGIIFAGLARMSAAWNLISILFVMILWAVSGVFFVPFYLPDILIYAMYINPLVHIIALFRSAYFDGFGSELTDIPYVVKWCIFSLCAALFLERLLRGRILQG